MYTNVRLKEHPRSLKSALATPLTATGKSKTWSRCSKGCGQSAYSHGKIKDMITVLRSLIGPKRHYGTTIPFWAESSCRCLFCWFANLALAVKGALSDMLFPWGHYLQSWGNHLLNMQTSKWSARAQKHLEVWCTNHFHPFSQELRGCCASLPRTLW